MSAQGDARRAKIKAEAERSLRHWEQVIELRYGGDVDRLPRFERFAYERARMRLGAPAPDWAALWASTKP